MLKFLVDECLGLRVAQWLVENGYDAVSGIKLMRGAKDVALVSWALSENRIIITSDKDFGDIAFRNKMHHAGIILMRLHNATFQNKIDVLENLLNNCADELADNFVLATETKIRIVKPIAH